METFFEVDADQIEVGDQILFYGDPLEVTHVMDDPADPLRFIIVVGFSHDTGDSATYKIKFNERFEAWAI